jgi:hypothetical protein
MLRKTSNGPICDGIAAWHNEIAYAEGHYALGRRPECGSRPLKAAVEKRNEASRTCMMPEAEKHEVCSLRYRMLSGKPSSIER